MGDEQFTWPRLKDRDGIPEAEQNDLRRTAVRNLVRAGVPERLAMQMTGRKTRSVFERYNIVSDSDLTAAARRLDEVAGIVSGIVEQSDGTDARYRMRIAE